MAKCNKNYCTSVEIAKHLKGERKSTNKEKEYDVKDPLKQEACFEKLKTEVSFIFFLIYLFIIVFIELFSYPGN